MCRAFFWQDFKARQSISRTTRIRPMVNHIVPTWKAKCPIFKAIVAGFRGKVAQKNRTLGVPGTRPPVGAPKNALQLQSFP